MQVSPVCLGGMWVASAYWIVHLRQLPACPTCPTGPTCPPDDVLPPHAAVVAAAMHTIRSAILLTSNASQTPSEPWVATEETVLLARCIIRVFVDVMAQVATDRDRHRDRDHKPEQDGDDDGRGHGAPLETFHAWKVSDVVGPRRSATPAPRRDAVAS